MSKQDQLSAVYAADAASQEIRAALSTAREALAEAQVTVRLLEDGCDKVWDKAYDNYLEERRTTFSRRGIILDFNKRGEV